MNFHVMTLFPELIEAAAKESILGRAAKAGFISVTAVNFRDYAKDVRAMAMDVLRHRVILTYEAEAEEKTSEELVQNILDTVKVP